MTLLPVLVGAILGGLFALAARGRPRPMEMRLMARGLVVAALIYLGLALARADYHWLWIEFVGVGIFGAVAWLGARFSPWWLAVGWAAHMAWDVGLHVHRSQPVVSASYPLLCVGFDLVVAGYLLGRTSTVRA